MSIRSYITESSDFTGLAQKKGITEKDVDPKELAMGIKIEMEHTDNKQLAKHIALDHLAEKGGEKYYTRLKDMEKNAGITEDGDRGISRSINNTDYDEEDDPILRTVKVDDKAKEGIREYVLKTSELL